MPDNPATIKKVAIYIRVSTKFQVDKDSLSVQRRELGTYSEMILNCSDYVVFEDAGYSAKNTDRPDYQRMMARLRTGEFSHLLVWKIDRISRNLLDFTEMYNELRNLGITFVSKNEQFDTSNAIGEAMLKIILVFAELERKMTSERVTDVMLSRASNGQWNGGRIPYGYQYDKASKKFSENPSEAKTVRTIYNMYEQYRSLIYVARYLNQANIKTRRGYEWTPTVIQSILRNPFYIGSYVYNVHDDGKGGKKKEKKEWITVENHHEAIISKKQYDSVSNVLTKNQKNDFSFSKAYVRKNIHVFAGLVKCGECGCAMTASPDRCRASGWRPSIYGCARRRRNSGACTNKFVSDASIGDFIINYIANIIRLKSVVNKNTSLESLEKRILRGEAFKNVTGMVGGLEEIREMLLSGESGFEYKPSIATSTPDKKESEVEYLNERYRKCETVMNRLKTLYLYGDGSMSQTEYILEREKILEELAGIEKKLTELNNAELTRIDSNDEFSQKASYFIMLDRIMNSKYINYEKFSLSVDKVTQRAFFLQVIEKVIVKDGRVTSIYFRNGIVNTFTYAE